MNRQESSKWLVSSDFEFMGTPGLAAVNAPYQPLTIPTLLSGTSIVSLARATWMNAGAEPSTCRTCSESGVLLASVLKHITRSRGGSVSCQDKVMSRQRRHSPEVREVVVRLVMGCARGFSGTGRRLGCQRHITAAQPRRSETVYGRLSV